VSRMVTWRERAGAANIQDGTIADVGDAQRASLRACALRLARPSPYARTLRDGAISLGPTFRR